MLDSRTPTKQGASRRSVEGVDSRVTRVDLRDRWIGRETEQERDDKQLPKEALDIMVDEEDCRLVTGADRESMEKDYEEVMEHL